MTKKETICIVGLGYVGLPVAVAFSKKYPVIGFDINTKRLEALQKGVDLTGEISPEDLKASPITYTSTPTDLKDATFFIVTVPTPIDAFNKPDFTALIKASETIGSVLKPHDTVVYESTVYPGATEEVCLPILEARSGLRAAKDFGLGYSPERINPADKEHTFTKIAKVVSGCDEASLRKISHTYGQVIEAPIFEASSIQVAEAAKVIENIQRDVNIALINELAMLFDRLHIDTLEVLEAAGTKWNFLPFRPGLVGGHCIGVDPYYLTHKAESVGYHPQVILSGRRINNTIPHFIVYRMLQELIGIGKPIVQCKITVMGLAFKENCPDIRNSKAIDIVRELQKFQLPIQLYDPIVEPEDVEEEYGLSLSSFEELAPADVIIFAVGHEAFKNTYQEILRSKLKPQGLIIDVKGITDPDFLQTQGIHSWRL